MIVFGYVLRVRDCGHGFFRLIAQYGEFMLRRISSTTIWLLLFGILVAVQAYSTFAQTSELTGYSKNGSVVAISYQNCVTAALPLYLR